MAHIFFEKLEKRQSTQSLVPTFMGNTSIQPVYGVQVWPDPDTQQFFPEYGIGMPNPPSTASPGGYFPWGGGLFGMSGYTPYNPSSSWTNPFNNYNPWSPWGSGNYNNPFTGFFGGLFGGMFPWSWRNNNPIIPDIRMLYGITPTPQPLYGVSIAPTPPTDITTFYGVGIPSIGSLY